MLVGRMKALHFLCRKTTASSVPVIEADENGRCLCLSLKLYERMLRIFYIYFSCFESGADYTVKLGDYLGLTEKNKIAGYESVIIGNENFECDLSNMGFRMCNS